MNSFSAAQRSRVTMLDVAERAGVSKASVSRFIGEDRALLSDAIALRIEQAIAELGYRPNQMARGLKRGRTRLIGMLVADIRNPYSIAVMHGVETACRQHGYSLVVCNTDRDDEQERQHLANLRSYNIEGLIVNTLGHHLDELRELHREMPMVLVDRKVEQLHSDLVGLDNPQAVRSAIEHLQEHGYRDLLLVSEPHDGTSSRIERSNSFKAQIEQRPALQGAAVETGAALNQQLQQFLAAPARAESPVLRQRRRRPGRDPGLARAGLRAVRRDRPDRPRRPRLVSAGGHRHHRPRPAHRAHRRQRLRVPAQALARRCRAAAGAGLPGRADRPWLHPTTRNPITTRGKVVALRQRRDRGAGVAAVEPARLRSATQLPQNLTPRRNRGNTVPAWRVLRPRSQPRCARQRLQGIAQA
ncbi:2-ketogluconate utilization repressor PtxS [Pseudomonas chlororaphis subsp. aurantiaca]|nr:2-ketogluconate utilization repressor PtxS [Pseudomonas chlororaphis subsp. aurantiaca]